MNRITKIDSGLVRGLPGNWPAFTVFKGIPFARPPVGDLRWKAPQLPEKWDGVLDCFRFRNPPMQIALPQKTLYQEEFFPVPEECSEDCLYLSVWTPSRHFNPADKLPVMVWYHGGAYKQGADHEPEFDGEAFNRNGVILVTVPYRLGVFGYFAHPELSREDGGHSGNYALMDQIFALEWVRRNISAFGGDPDNVTIFGQSAGGGSVQAICCSPLARGLFHKAIIMSASALQTLGDSMTLADGEAFGVGLSEYLGKSLTEMRAMTPDALMYLAADYADHAPGKPGLRYKPIIDGHVLTYDPGKTFTMGRNADVPYMMGSVAGDSGLFGLPEEDYASFTALLPMLYGEHAPAILEAFGIHDDESLRATAAERRQAYAIGQSEAFAMNRNALNQPPVYTYHFSRDIPGDDHPGTFHSSELWYVFGTVHRCWRPFTGVDFDLSRLMNAYWCNFAKTGNPNGDGLPEWKPHTADEPCHMLINENEVRSRDVRENPTLARFAPVLLHISRRCAVHSPVGD